MEDNAAPTALEEDFSKSAEGENVDPRCIPQKLEGPVPEHTDIIYRTTGQRVQGVGAFHGPGFLSRR